MSRYWHDNFYGPVLEAVLANEEWETGEPPRRDIRIFAEHFSTYAQSGVQQLDGERVTQASRKWNPMQKVATLAEPMSAEEMKLAEDTWARLPSFDDLVKGRP